MVNDLTLRRIDASVHTIQFTYQGKAIDARETDTVAAALHAAGIISTRRTPVDNQPRGAFCMMGVCFDCLVQIDGVPNRQACMVVVQAGMAVMPMDGVRNVAVMDQSASDEFLPPARPENTSEN